VIQLKSSREIDLMAEGGKILAATVQMLRREVRAGISTEDLDRIAEAFIRSHPGATPAFKGLYGFPGTLCTSINQEIVHGIPSKKRVLKEGDIISIDVGVGYQGYFTDSATTVAVGVIDAETARLLETTERSLAAGIAAAMPALDSLMKAFGKNYSGTNYDGATHGFLRAQNDPKAQNRDEVEEAANLAATNDAWPKTLAFLRKHLGVN